VSTIIGFIFETLDLNYLNLFGIEQSGSNKLGEMFMVGIVISLFIFLMIADRIIWYLKGKLFSEQVFQRRFQLLRLTILSLLLSFLFLPLLYIFGKNGGTCIILWWALIGIVLFVILLLLLKIKNWVMTGFENSNH